jgi:hypothetical protein
MDVFRRALVPLKIMGATIALPWLSLAAGLFTGALIGRETSNRLTISLAVLWILTLPLAYVLLDFHVLSRYMLPVTPAVVILGAVGLGAFMDRFNLAAAWRRRVLVAFAAAVMIQNIVFYHLVIVPPTRAFSNGLRDVVAGMGSWLEKNSDPGSVVAAPDIGAIGYVSMRTVLDLGGLVTPEINRLRRRIDFERIVEEGLYLELEPDFMVDRSEIPQRFAGKIIRGVRFVPVMQGTVSNLGIRKPDPVVYVLYRLEAAGAEKSGGGY